MLYSQVKNYICSFLLELSKTNYTVRRNLFNCSLVKQLSISEAITADEHFFRIKSHFRKIKSNYYGKLWTGVGDKWLIGRNLICAMQYFGISDSAASRFTFTHDLRAVQLSLHATSNEESELNAYSGFLKSDTFRSGREQYSAFLTFC